MRIFGCWLAGRNKPAGSSKAPTVSTTFSKSRHGRFRDSDLFHKVFENVVARCLAEGVVGRAMNLSRSSITLHSFQGTLALKCHLCLRNGLDCTRRLMQTSSSGYVATTQSCGVFRGLLATMSGFAQSPRVCDKCEGIMEMHFTPENLESKRLYKAIQSPQPIMG